MKPMFDIGLLSFKDSFTLNGSKCQTSHVQDLIYTQKQVLLLITVLKIMFVLGRTNIYTIHKSKRVSLLNAQDSIVLVHSL